MNQRAKSFCLTHPGNMTLCQKYVFDGVNYLEVVEELKLLGIIFQSNMRWHANSANLCKTGYARLWMLRNLKKHGAGRTDLLDVYMKQVRSTLELAV